MQENETSKKPKIYTMAFADIYLLYIQKAKHNHRTESEVESIIQWLLGYDHKGLQEQLNQRSDFETFITKAPKLNPARANITGSVCGVKIKDINEPIMKEIRYLDKLIDELAQGKDIKDILRK